MDKKPISLSKLLKQSSFPKILCGVQKYKKVEGDLMSINNNFLLFEYPIHKLKKSKNKNRSSNKSEYIHSYRKHKLNIILRKNDNIKKTHINNNNIIKEKTNLSPIFNIKEERNNKTLKPVNKKIKFNLNNDSSDPSFNIIKNANYFPVNLKKNNQIKINRQKEKSNYSTNTIGNLNNLNTLYPMKKPNKLFLTKSNIKSYNEKNKQYFKTNHINIFTDIFDAKNKKHKENNLSDTTTKTNYELKNIINTDICSCHSNDKNNLKNSEKKEILNFVKFEYNLAKKNNLNVSKKLNLAKLKDNNSNKKTKIRYFFWKYQLPIIRKYYYDINAFKHKEIELREENKTFYEKLDEIVESIRKNKKDKNKSYDEIEESEQTDFFSIDNKDRVEEEEDILNKILKKKEVISNSLKEAFKRMVNQKKNHKVVCNILYKNYKSAQKIKKSKSLIKYDK